MCYTSDKRESDAVQLKTMVTEVEAGSKRRNKDRWDLCLVLKLPVMKLRHL